MAISTKLRAFMTKKRRREEYDKTELVFRTIQTSKNLDRYFTSLARVLDLYDRSMASAAFKDDIQTLLFGAIDIAEAMLDRTYSAPLATVTIAEHQRILAKITRYLCDRPTRMGYSLLFTDTGMLMGQFSTEPEAQLQLRALQSVGSAVNAIVVPVRITSDFTLQARDQDLTMSLAGPIGSGTAYARAEPQAASPSGTGPGPGPGSAIILEPEPEDTLDPIPTCVKPETSLEVETEELAKKIEGAMRNPVGDKH